MSVVRMPAALLWDVDGTLAETELDGHRVAFNLAFEAMGLAWRWDEAHYGRLLAVTGGRERLLHDMQQRADAPGRAAERDALARALHALKNSVYARLVAESCIPLRMGVLSLLQACRNEGVPMAITTTTSRSNVAALMGAALGERWSAWFAVCVCGEDVQAKKPHPEVYLKALEALQLKPSRALAIEDSPAGVQAACAAGVPVVVTRSVYFADAALDDALAVGPGLHTRRGWLPRLPELADSGAMVGLEDLAFWCGLGAGSR